MSVLGRMRKAAAAALFPKNSVKRVTVLLRGLAAGLVASVTLALSTELFAGGEWPDGPNKHWFQGLNVLITPSIHTETKNLFSVAG
jgi:hypothetical protein